MEHAPRKSPSGVSAGMLLASAIILTIGIGALLGRLAGSVGIGIVIGAVVGIPLGTAIVLVVYRGSRA
jgi:F0F1-type ATP synthase assembly protein I